jgi:hypothetical protein
MPRYIEGDLPRIRKIRPPVKRLVRLRLRREALRQPFRLTSTFLATRFTPPAAFLAARFDARCDSSRVLGRTLCGSS